MNTVKGDTNRVELDCGNDCTNSQLYHVILSKYMLHELYFNKAHKKKPVELCSGCGCSVLSKFLYIQYKNLNSSTQGYINIKGLFSIILEFAISC